MRRTIGLAAALPLVTVLTTGLALGCDAEKKSPTAVDHSGETIAGLVVTADGLTLQAGHSMPLQVVGVCAHGNPMGEVTVEEWAVDDARFAVVHEDGSLAGLHSGTVTVRAESLGFVGTLEISVLPFGATFGSDGGLLTSLDGGASVEVPEGALGHNQPMTLETVFAESLGELAESLIGTAYRFGTGDSCNETLRINISYGSVSTEAPWLRLHRLVDGAWVELPESEVDEGTKTVSGLIYNAGVYAMIPTTPHVQRVEVEPASVALMIGESMTFVATAYDRYGIELTECVFVWTVSDPEIVAMSGEGQVVGLEIGAATVAATCDGVAGYAGLVVGSSVHSIVVDEAAITLRVGDTYALSALPISKTGEAVARPLTWKSDDMSIVTVDAAGVVTAMRVGLTKVRAESDGHWTKVTVTVVPADVPVAYMRITPLKTMLNIGEAVTLVVTFYDAQGNPIAGGPVAWSSLNPAVAVVNGNGVVEAIGSGLAVIEAVSGPLSATAEVLVGGPAAMRILPESSEIDRGEELRLIVQFFDAYGEPMTGGPVTWTSMKPEVMSVNENGVVTPHKVGEPTKIRAVSGLLYAEAVVFCRPGEGS